MSPTTLDYAFYDVVSRRRKSDGESYLKDTRLLVGGAIVLFENGRASQVPAHIAKLINDNRRDVYIVPSGDQTPPVIPDLVAGDHVEEDFEPIPLDAVQAEPQAGGGQVGERDESGHRIPPGRPEVSPEELEARRLAAQAYLDQLPAQERPGANGGVVLTPPPAPEPEQLVEAADGKPITVPAGVQLGATPGWPVDEFGRPLRLTSEQRAESARLFVAKTGGDDLETPPGDAEGTASSSGAGLNVPPTTTGVDATPPAGTDEPPKVTVPQGFALHTGSGELRCLATKADGSQCQNAAREGHACQHAPHKEQVALLAPA